MYAIRSYYVFATGITGVNAMHAFTRITAIEGKARNACPARVAQIVITSYSIHYTKLYDFTISSLTKMSSA